MLLLNLIKKALGFIGTSLVVILMAPGVIAIIILAVTGISIVTSYDWLFRKIRNDPNIKLEPFAPPIKDGEIEETSDAERLEHAIDYFDKLTDQIHQISGARAGKLIQKINKSSYAPEDPNIKVIELTKNLHSDTASIQFELDIEQHEYPNEKHAGKKFYSSDEDADDYQLAGNIHANITLSEFPDWAFQIYINYDQEAAHFCVALLKSDYKFNQKTGQLWVYLADKKVWMVAYKKNGRTEFGFRSTFLTGKAHKYWVDGKSREES